MKVTTKLNKIIDFLKEQEEVEEIRVEEIPFWASDMYSVSIFFKDEGVAEIIHVSMSTSVKKFKESYKNYIKRKKEK